MASRRGGLRIVVDGGLELLGGADTIADYERIEVVPDVLYINAGDILTSGAPTSQPAAKQQSELRRGSRRIGLHN